MAYKGCLLCIVCLAALQTHAVRTNYDFAGLLDQDSESDASQSGFGAHTALIVIDVQDCFLNASTTNKQPGNLAVTNSHRIIDKINQLRRVGDGCLWGPVVFSQDHHLPQHISFASTHPGKKPYEALPMTCISPDHEEMETETDASCCPDYVITDKKGGKAAPARFANTRACQYCIDSPDKCIPNTQTLWPDHCVQGVDDAFSPKLYARTTDITVKKGTNLDVDSYSAFRDNTKSIKTETDSLLKNKGVNKVILVGIAEDVCVKFSALDAVSMGYEVFVVKDASAGLTEENEAQAEKELSHAGVHVVNTADLLKKAKACR